MQVNIHLFFNGQCEAALKFYEQVLGARPEMLMRYESAPVQCPVPDDWKGKVMHARVALGDTVVLAADAPPGSQQEAKGFRLCLGLDKPAEAERVFHALAEGGTVQMAMEKTFFAERFGMLTDRFGTPWMVICEHAA